MKMITLMIGWVNLTSIEGSWSGSSVKLGPLLPFTCGLNSYGQSEWTSQRFLEKKQSLFRKRKTQSLLDLDGKQVSTEESQGHISRPFLP